MGLGISAAKELKEVGVEGKKLLLGCRAVGLRDKLEGSWGMK